MDLPSPSPSPSVIVSKSSASSSSSSIVSTTSFMHHNNKKAAASSSSRLENITFTASCDKYSNQFYHTTNSVTTTPSIRRDHNNFSITDSSAAAAATGGSAAAATSATGGSYYAELLGGGRPRTTGKLIIVEGLAGRGGHQRQILVANYSADGGKRYYCTRECSTGTGKLGDKNPCSCSTTTSNNNTKPSAYGGGYYRFCWKWRYYPPKRTAMTALLRASFTMSMVVFLLSLYTCFTSHGGDGGNSGEGSKDRQVNLNNPMDPDSADADSATSFRDTELAHQRQCPLQPSISCPNSPSMLLLSAAGGRRKKKAAPPDDASSSQRWSVVHLAVVACGDRLEEPLTMLKSALTLSSRGSNAAAGPPLHFHVFTDDHLRIGFAKQLDEWLKAVEAFNSQSGQQHKRQRQMMSFGYSLYKIQFPPDQADKWRNLFKTCACQRLFIPDILKHLDSVIYVDTDTLFHRPVQDLWDHLARFNSSQISGLAMEGEDAATNWYRRFARHPYYPPFGVNSGVMLMNLTRMRRFGWTQLLWPLFTEYQYRITWGDQDIINILFHQHPDKLYIFGCEWNYRPDHCMYRHVCDLAKESGVRIVHGSRSYFHLPDKQPAFKAVYDAWKNYPVGSNLSVNLIEPMTKALTQLRTTNQNNRAAGCIQNSDVFLAQLRTSYDDLQ